MSGRDASGPTRRAGAPGPTPAPATAGDEASEPTPSTSRTARIRAELSVAGQEAKQRLETAEQPIRQRFDEPIKRVTAITERTLALFPVRVWRRFLDRNGFILAAGLSYQALFAVFAALYVVFAIAGLWLTNNPDALNALLGLINTLAPGLVGENGSAGVISEQDVTEIARSSTSLFGWTGAVALAGLIWTAIGWITYTRTAVRSIFGLPKDTRAYLLLKARDLLAGLGFGLVLLLASVLSLAATSFVSWVFSLLGWSSESGWFTFFVQLGSLVAVFLIDTLALAVLFRFLSGAAMPWRRMWIGSLLGSAGLSVLQLFSSLLLSSTSRNPLLATFTVFIGLLLWFRLTSIVILVASAWIAVEAGDAHESLRMVTPEQLEAERLAEEHRALVTAARVRVREAEHELGEAGWFARFPARRRLERARLELEEIERGGPGPAERP
ncbi:YihY/virulence factor BrkB family protein [Agromyces sp. NPDC060279]|uniref:YihY/virulence factor BrkB family protein n=1 Tax=Agromyces sp. NPDC060279 TaxID=3347092 RepID=UPI003651BF82